MQGLHGLHGFAAAHGLHGLQGLHGLAAAHGLQGLHGLHGFEAAAAHGLHGLASPLVIQPPITSGAAMIAAVIKWLCFLLILVIKHS